MNQSKNVKSFNDKHSIMKMDDTTKNIVYNKSVYHNIENNNMSKLQAIAKDRKLRGYSRMRKSELINKLTTRIKTSIPPRKYTKKYIPTPFPIPAREILSYNDITDNLSKWGDWLHNRKSLEK